MKMREGAGMFHRAFRNSDKRFEFSKFETAIPSEFLTARRHPLIVRAATIIFC